MQGLRIMSQMSSYEDESDTMEELGEAADRFQKFMKSIPVQAKLVSDMSANQAQRLSREMDKVRVPRARRELNRVAVPAVRAKDLPPQPRLSHVQTPKIPRTNSSFSMFAGKRRKVKSGMSILTGR